MGKKPLIINLFSGPGAGKSQGAAYIFSHLKAVGINCELVTEFAKDKTWEKSTKAFENQAYIFGKQFFRITRLHDEVDVVITDSPLPLSVIYNTNIMLGDHFNKMVLNVFNSYENINFYLNRVKPYNPKGRNQSLAESIEIDKKILSLLDNNYICYEVIDGNFEGYNKAISHIIKKIL